MNSIMQLKGKKLFITGAGGFIGSHVVEAAVQAGARVTGLIHYNSAASKSNAELLPPEISKEVEWIFGDIRDAEHMLSATKNTDVILHLAALIGIPYSYVAPRSYVDTNITGTLNLLEAARQNQVSRIVSTSTSETYGTALYTPIDEEHPLQGQSPYSATKIGADKICESYFRSFETPVVVLRPFNTYGPRQSMRAVTPTIITQALFSDQLKLGSLSPVRDLLYVKDTARAFLAAASAEGLVGKTVHVGTGTAVSIKDLVESVFKILNFRKNVVTDEGRIRPGKSEVMTLICNPQRAKEWMGWEPEYSLEQGLTETIDFIRGSSASEERLSRYAI